MKSSVMWAAVWPGVVIFPDTVYEGDVPQAGLLGGSQQGVLLRRAEGPCDL